MYRRYSRALRVISVVVLSFFLWTFGGLFEAAYAVKENGQKSESSSQKSVAGSLKGRDQHPALNSQSPREHRAEQKFDKTIEDIETILKDEKTDHATKKHRIHSKKAEIDADDVELRKQFTDTEQKIKDLPEVIKKRHRDFVKHYDDNLRELKTNLDEIDRHNPGSREHDEAVKRTKTHLDKTKPPKRQKHLDPNKLPHRTEEPVWKEPRTKPEEFTEGKELRAQKGKPILVASNGTLDGLLSTNTQYDTKANTLLPDGSYQIALANSPTTADFAEAIEVQFTPEIVQLAADLDHNPVKIFDFVRNYIEFVPTHGSIQGAHQTLLSGKGNAFDQASLMVALLRASGIAAKYEYGTVEVPIEQVKRWLGGFTDAMSALRLMASGGMPVKGLVDAGGVIQAVRFEHIWVSAWIDYIPSRGAVHRQGDMWIALDPSFKLSTYYEGVDFQSAIPFDVPNLLAEIQQTATIDLADGSITNVDTAMAQTRIDEYGTQIETYLNTNYPNAIEDQILGYGEIARKELAYLPLNLPYTVTAKGWSSAQIPGNLRQTLNFTLLIDSFDELAGTPLNYAVSLPEIAGKRITLSYSPATTADRDTIRKLIPKAHQDGSPIQLSELPSTFPSYLIKLKPELRIGGQVVATGTTVNIGSSEQFTVTLRTPSKAVRAVDKELVAGEFYAIGLDVMPLGEDVIEEKILNHYDLLEQVKAKTVYPTKDDLYGEFLHTVALGYFDQADAFEQRLAKMMGVVTLRLPSIGIVQSSLKVKYVFGTPFATTAEGMFLDIQFAYSATAALDGNAENIRTFNFVTGLYESGLEHSVPEQLFSTISAPVEGVSTVKILGIANSQGIPVHTITAANIAIVLPKIQTGITTEIQSAVNAGKEVITPERNVTINGWTGTGYIIYDPATGNGAYVISGNKNGGFLTALGSYWIACGTVIYDDDPMFGMEVITSGINLIIEAQDLWARVLKTAAKASFDFASMFIPWGKVAGNINMAFGCIAGTITKNAARGNAFEKIMLKIFNIEKNTLKIPTPKGMTIPDHLVAESLINPTAIWEIKSGNAICNSGNVAKQIARATLDPDNLIPYYLVVRKGAYVSGPVKEAISITKGALYRYNEITGTITKEIL